MIFSVVSSYVILWYARTENPKSYHEAREKKKFTLLITFFLFLAFIIEPWGQTPLGYATLKFL